jgi:hypothetical protein
MMTSEEISEAFTKLSDELRERGADPKVVILYSLAHAISIHKGMDYTEGEFGALLNFAWGLSDEATLVDEEAEA